MSDFSLGFCFWIYLTFFPLDTGSYSVAQPGLKLVILHFYLLNAGITSMNHDAQLMYITFNLEILILKNLS
jgi:hypothetical protein